MNVRQSIYAVRKVSAQTLQAVTNAPAQLGCVVNIAPFMTRVLQVLASMASAYPTVKTNQITPANVKKVFTDLSVMKLW